MSMSETFIEWLIALLLSLSALTGQPADTEVLEVSHEPTTSTTLAAPEAAETAGEAFYSLSASCGNGLYDTKFDPCPEQYNAVHGYLPLVQGHFWDTSYEDAIIAMCVMYGESRGTADVTNSIGARGLFQIMPNWADNAWAGTEGITYDMLLIPEYNVFVARKVWEKQGWDAWSAYRRGYVQDCININAFNSWVDESGTYHGG